MKDATRIWQAVAIASAAWLVVACGGPNPAPDERPKNVIGVSKTTFHSTETARDVRVVTDDGVELSAQSVGGFERGPALLVIGEVGVSSAPYRDLGLLAARDLAVVTFDPRGVGASGGDATNAVRVERLLDDVDAVRDALELTSVHLLGHGSGALLALEYGLNHPDRVASLTLVAPRAPTPAGAIAHRQRRRQRLERLASKGVVASNPPRECGARWSRSLRARFADPTLDPGLPSAPECEEASIAGFARARPDDDFVLRLARFERPTLLLTGAGAPGAVEVHDAYRDALGETLVDARMLESCGDLPWLECPVPTFRAIDVFLSSFTRWR